MDSFLRAAVLLLPLAYLAATVEYGLAFFVDHRPAGKAATPTLRAVLGFHLLFLVVLTLRWSQYPATTVSQALSVIALAVGAVYAFVEWRSRERSTGFWLVSLVFLFQLLSSLLVKPEPPQRELFHNPLFAAHVSAALLGYAAFAVAAAYGFLFLRLYRELKSGRFSTFYDRLPPLEVLERMMVGALAVGFVALSGAVATGVVSAGRAYGESFLRDPKTLTTFAIWILYGASLALRRLRRWQGRQTAVVSLAGLGAILLSLVAVNFLFTGFHGFG
jgi:HemX protein